MSSELTPVNPSGLDATPQRKRNRGKSITPQNPDTAQKQNFEQSTKQRVADISDQQMMIVREQVEGVVNLADTAAQIIHEAEQALPFLTEKRLAELRGQATDNREFFRTTTQSAFDSGIDQLESLRSLIN